MDVSPPAGFLDSTNATVPHFRYLAVLDLLTAGSMCRKGCYNCCVCHVLSRSARQDSKPNFRLSKQSRKADQRANWTSSVSETAQDMADCSGPYIVLHCIASGLQMCLDDLAEGPQPCQALVAHACCGQQLCCDLINWHDCLRCFVQVPLSNVFPSAVLLLVHLARMTRGFTYMMCIDVYNRTTRINNITCTNTGEEKARRSSSC